MLNWLKDLGGKWRIEGWDTYAGESYPIPGRYASKTNAVSAAKRYLKKLERQQPSEISGGQEGIQDHVHVIGPEGETLRILP